MNPARARHSATWFVTALTHDRCRLFLADAWATLLLDTLLLYRSQRRFLLHQFVIMPDHLHLILTPSAELPGTVEIIQRGFSARASEGLGSRIEVWQHGFTGHPVSNADEYERWRELIVSNPRRAGWIGEYRFSSASSAFALDDVPKPLRACELIPR